MLHSGDHVKMFVDFMNTKHPNTCFTFEIEHQKLFEHKKYQKH